ncbi:hypothetical protein [Methylobrevis albus]|uniref:Uncharacterized protein n=1 Tax=Methylobrevis albus TaxID=2793297 RepID=A0A931HZ67_9HYPH|nr:hypothetical protein [Methylobrevis albus]MBH0236419.1 hypothetical protein [Methylobrevis albus]
MNSSPITTWEGAGAYFTFADKPAVIAFFLLAATVACFGAIVIGFLHENKSFKNFE